MGNDVRRKRSPLCLAIGLALLASAARAATITVNSDQDNQTSGDGFCTLREAIVSINSGSVGSSSCTATGAFGVDDTIDFAGALANAVIRLSGSQLEISAPMTIDGSGQTLSGDSKSRIFYVPVSTLIASSLTLSSGAASGAQVFDDYGGAIYALGSTVALSHVMFDSNSAYKSGGAISQNLGSLTISDGTIQNNLSETDGGGLRVVRADLSIVDSTISGNTAATAGAISSAYDSGTLTNVYVHGNSAASQGGLFSFHDDVTIVDSLFSGNDASAMNAYGGALVAADSNLRLVNDTFYYNPAGAKGALYVTSYGSPSTVTMVNSTVSADTAGSGGGTIVTAGATLLLRNSILANDAGYDCILDHSSSLSSSYSLVGSNNTYCTVVDGSNGNIVGSDPKLGQLSGNGGPTKTMALLPGSPAIGTGSVALAVYKSYTLSYDQRGIGFPRILAGTVDIGAFQHQPTDRIFDCEFDSGP